MINIENNWLFLAEEENLKLLDKAVNALVSNNSKVDKEDVRQEVVLQIALYTKEDDLEAFSGSKGLFHNRCKSKVKNILRDYIRGYDSRMEDLTGFDTREEESLYAVSGI